MKKEKMALDVVNPQAAGIDVGSRSHYVAIGQRDEDVKEFGVYNEDLIALAQWLLDNVTKHSDFKFVAPHPQKCRPHTASILKQKCSFIPTNNT